MSHPFGVSYDERMGFGEWVTKRKERPTDRDTCDFCGVRVAPGDGKWRPMISELTCGANDCEKRSQALQNW